MTLRHIRENLEHARDEGIPCLASSTTYTSETDAQGYVQIKPQLHESKLYSICEGLIAEIERLQARVAALESQVNEHDRHVQTLRPLSGPPPWQHPSTWVFPTGEDKGQ